MRETGHSAHGAGDHAQCIADAMSAAERVCAERGVRLTAQRRRVLELVWAGHQPVGAYDLLARLKDDGSAGAPPTIYRALDFLLAQGLIHRIESLNAFVGCSHPAKAHAGLFMICRVCRQAEEVEDAATDRALAGAAGARGFALEGRTLELSGVCALCRKAEDV